MKTHNCFVLAALCLSTLGLGCNGPTTTGVRRDAQQIAANNSAYDLWRSQNPGAQQPYWAQSAPPQGSNGHQQASGQTMPVASVGDQTSAGAMRNMAVDNAAQQYQVAATTNYWDNLAAATHGMANTAGGLTRTSAELMNTVEVWRVGTGNEPRAINSTGGNVPVWQRFNPFAKKSDRYKR